MPVRPIPSLLAAILLALSLAASCGDPEPRSQEDTSSTDTDAAADTDLTVDSGVPPDTAGDATIDVFAGPGDGCNPLGWKEECLLPFPSDVFLVDDSATATGKRVVLGPAALHFDNEPVDFTVAHPADGFPLIPTILALFPAGVDAGDLIGHGAPGASLDMTSTTVLLRASDGAPVMHFAELDMTADGRPAAQALLIRPMTRLEPATRYVVGIRGLHQPDGLPVPPPERFRRLRDAEDDADLAPLAARYEADVFAPLAAVGVARSELQLAWDFTTRSEGDATDDARAVVNDVSARLTATPPSVTITDVQDQVSPMVGRRVEFEVTVPLYLESDVLGAALRRDSVGSVEAAGTVQVPGLVIVPQSVLDNATNGPAPVVHMGHGFFGARTEFDTDWAVAMANTYGFVMVAVDWWGLSVVDREWVIQTIMTEPSLTLRIVDRVHQAMANHVALTHAIRGPLSADPALELDGLPLLDGGRVSFYGISAGAMLGTMLFALSPDYDRGAFSVGGGYFSFIMSRSVSFAPLNAIVGLRAKGTVLNQQKFMALSQLTLDRIDPVVYAAHLVADRWDGQSDRQVLWQVGMGDPAVPVLSSHVVARTAQMSVLQPGPRSLPALPEVTSPTTASVLVELDFGLASPLPGDLALPPSDNEVHEGVRRVPPAQEQLTTFLFDGVLEHTCDGPCDPE